MRRVLVAAVALVATTGCAPDLERAEIEPVTTPPLDHTVSGAGVVLTQGSAIAVQVRAFDEDGDRSTAELAVTADNPTLRVFILDHDANTGTRFVFMADQPGLGQLFVSERGGSNGQVALPFIVTEQGE